MDIQKALRELCNEVKMILKYRIVHYGVNPKTGTNTLQGSDLEKSIEVKPTENGIALQIADYWEYVALGWHRSHRFEGTMNQFVRNINDWVRRKGIRLGNMTQAQMVFVIIRNIMNNGLRERPFMIWDEEGDLSKMIPELENIMDDWFETLFEAITADLDNYFKAA
jgi:hypothetical protein